MDNILKYMKDRKWAEDYKADRKVKLIKEANNSSKKNNIPSKIGAMLIYTQVIEQCIKEIIEASSSYIKAEIWPTDVDINIDLDKSTFGDVIEKFKKFGIKEKNREYIINSLKKFNKNRNKVVHNLFNLENENELNNELDFYNKVALELVELLIEYYNDLMYKFFDLENRVDFNDLTE